MRIPCSPDQLEAIADHAFSNAELGMVADERAWIIAHVRKVNPLARVAGAELDLERGEWLIELQT